MNFDIVIDSDENIVDMKTGLETMQGASEIVRLITETVLTNKVPERKSHKSSVRTNLKKSFKGSYGHTFSLDIYDSVLKNNFAKIGEQTLMEVISYLLSESLYQASNNLSLNAQNVINDLNDNYEVLLGKLRQTPLKSIHESPIKLNKNVKLRYRKNDNDQTIIVQLDRLTAKALDTKTDNTKYSIMACITRFNIHTGNGRLLVNGEEETVPFSISIPYRNVKLDTKKKFSRNLDENNGINDNTLRTYINMSVKRINSYGGQVVKYVIIGI
ncbi:hypothetical protein [Vibrio metschnikovii]|uniref:hypothetical protein n=1 Tax=Vibrio metschnikovii TaxID=28172 RepID=UPI00165D4DE3|nr:hypothetical protein [Vibrio metschnikovii]